MSTSLGEKRRRLMGYDYRSSGAYFITVCTDRRTSILSRVFEGKIELSETGRMVWEIWKSIPCFFTNVETDEAFVVMPNHIHGIIWIHDSTRGSSTTGESASLTSVMRWFKSLTTNKWQKTQTSFKPLWQRNYYDHIIRNEFSLTNIRNYILDNPRKWETDEYFSDRVL